MRAIMASTASSWPITRAVKKSRIDLRSSCSLVSSIETGRPENCDSVSSTRRAEIDSPVCSARIAVSLSRNKAEPGNPLVPRYWLAVSSATLAQSGSNWICRPAIQFGDHIAHQQQRRCRRQRLERHGFEQAAQRRLELHQPRGALGRRLAPHDQPAGGDRRHDLVEHGRALAGMPAAHGDLHDIGDVPDQLVPFRQFVDDLADAAFELADIDLIGLQIGAAGFEDAPVVGCQPLRQQPQERRLADQRLAGDQQRARRILAQRRFGERKRLAPAVRLDQRVDAVLGRPEPADRVQCRVRLGRRSRRRRQAA